MRFPLLCSVSRDPLYIKVCFPGFWDWPTWLNKPCLLYTGNVYHLAFDIVNLKTVHGKDGGKFKVVERSKNVSHLTRLKVKKTSYKHKYLNSRELTFSIFSCGNVVCFPIIISNFKYFSTILASFMLSRCFCADSNIASIYGGEIPGPFPRYRKWPE